MVKYFSPGLCAFVVFLKVLLCDGNSYYNTHYMSHQEKVNLKEKVKQMFHFGYDNYMMHAFPEDELNPIFCKGRGPDYENPSNININDVLGDYQLTLIDTLDTLAVMGNGSEFRRAVQLVIDYLSFDRGNTVQVFEANIRVLGALLSAHFILTDPKQPFGDMKMANYDGELLRLAHDLAARLLPAFENTGTGIPHPRVNLRNGVPSDSVNETCLAGAGSLLLEFGALSRLLGDPVYESSAKRAIRALWRYRSNVTGLFGNVINIHSGKWIGEMSGVGAGLDSFYEYLLKGYILFSDKEYLDMFRDSLESIRYYVKRGRPSCRRGLGHPPLYVNVNMKTGELANNWVDALQAAWPGVLVLNGQVEEAICVHAYFYAIWRKYGVLPERFNWYLKSPDVKFYPLRPELSESTYLLYKATRHPFYLHVGKRILENLEAHTKTKCGYATVHDVTNKTMLEDRMESFFLSETCKYLYLLFDENNPVNTEQEDFLFTTEGHIFPIRRLRFTSTGAQGVHIKGHRKAERRKLAPLTFNVGNHSNCENINHAIRGSLEIPLSLSYMEQIDSLVGL